MQAAVQSAGQGQATQAFAAALGLGQGVSGYMYHTLPVVIQAWLTHQGDFRAAIIAMVECGGDTDSTAAILGGVVGAATGRQGIPLEWQDGLLEWPRSLSWMARLGARLGTDPVGSSGKRAPGLFFPAVLLRNLFFLAVVLFHGFRRLLPPY